MKSHCKVALLITVITYLVCIQKAEVFANTMTNLEKPVNLDENLVNEVISSNIADEIVISENKISENIISENEISENEIDSIAHETKDVFTIPYKVLQQIGKSENEISDHLSLLGARSSSLYTLLKFSTGGYAIYVTEYQYALEFSTEGTFSLYDAVFDKPKYYFGPMNYYYEDSGRIISLIDSKIEVRLKDCLEAEDMIMRYVEQHASVRVTDMQQYEMNTYLNKSSVDNTLLANYVPFTMDSAEIVKRLPFGNNNDGTCGIVASAMLLTYAQKKGERVISNQYMPMLDIKEDKKPNGDVITKQDVLHLHLLYDYHYKDFTKEYATTAVIDADMLNTYLGKEAKNSNIHAVASPSILGVTNAIRSDIPVALYGWWELLPFSGMSNKGAHAVVAYGYSVLEGGSVPEYFKIHYGYHHPLYMDNDYTYNQTTKDFWISPVVVGESMWLEKTVKHTHTPYEERLPLAHGKHGEKIFKCVSCNALFEDDYSDYMERAGLLVFNQEDTENSIKGTTSASINRMSDVDFIKVVLPYKADITIRGDFDGTTAGVIYLLDSDGDIVTVASSKASRSVHKAETKQKALEAGTYYFKVTAGSEQNYELSASITSEDDYGDIMENAHNLSFDSDRTLGHDGRINYYGDVDFFRLEVPHKGHVTIQTDFEGNTLGLLYFNKSDGTPAASSKQVSRFANKRIIDGVLLEAGTYYIRVSAIEARNYKITASITSEDDCGDIMENAYDLSFESDGTVEHDGRINYKCDIDFFRLEVPYKGYVTVQADFDGTASGLLWFLNTNGSVVSPAKSASGNVNKTITERKLLNAGTYYIRVSSVKEQNYRISTSITSE